MLRILRFTSRLTLVIFVAFTTLAFAQSAGSASAGCSLAGSWYGGMPEAGFPYYHGTIVPSANGRLAATFQPNFLYGPPYLEATNWTGEATKTGPRTYQGFFMQMAAYDPAADMDPQIIKDLPEMNFISYSFELLDCNTFKGTLDVWYTYPNFTYDIKPLIDNPLGVWPGGIWYPDPPLVEVYHRVPDTCPACWVASTAPASAVHPNLEKRRGGSKK